MSRIFLLSSNVMVEPYHVYPLGMAMVASALSSAGHSVCQFDFLAEGESHTRLRSAIQEFSPDFVGVSLRNIDNVDSFTSEESWALASDRALVKTIREVTNATVVLGGPAFSIMPEEILGYVEADYGIVGDGGVLFNDLIERLEQGEKIPAISGERDTFSVGNIPLRPLWDETIINYYTRNNGMIGLQTKRGCPHNCTYCTYPAVEGTSYRAREPGAVIEDILRLKQDHNINRAFFTDSVFNDTEDLYLEIIEEILRREINIEWSAFFRPVAMEAKNMRMLKRSGLFAVEAGTDAASDTTLAGLNKSFCFHDVVRFNETCLKEAIPCVHYIMFGGPGETENTVGEGLDNVAFLKNCVVLAFSGIRIFPGTALHKMSIEDGLVHEKTSLLMPVFYFSPEVDTEHMNQTIEKAFKRQRNRIFPPSVGQEKIKILNRLGYQGPLWHKLVSYKESRSRP